ncbi:hypothetical protein D1872_195380 [compost metagenome]
MQDLKRATLLAFDNCAMCSAPIEPGEKITPVHDGATKKQTGVICSGCRNEFVN